MTRPMNAGWVVRHEALTPSEHATVSWWCGPDRSWGVSFGPLIEDATGTLSMAVAVFPTREEARAAINVAGLHSVHPVRLTDAIAEAEQIIEERARRQAEARERGRRSARRSPGPGRRSQRWAS